jgi:hypothetical protein
LKSRKDRNAHDHLYDKALKITPNNRLCSGWNTFQITTPEPLTGTVLSSSFSVWESEKDFPLGPYSCDKAKEMLSWLAVFTCDFCLSTPDHFFLFRTSSYICLPANWSGTCTLVHQTPDVGILPNNQSLRVPLLTPLLSRAGAKTAIQKVPLLVGLGLSASLGTGIMGITTSSLYFQQLSSSFTNTLDELSQSISTLQNQLDSLALVILQNHQALDLPTSEKGGMCLFLQEECYFYVN